MPLEVMRYIIGILPRDIVVFDPFMGSGTTALVCKEYNVDFVGTEIDKDYYELSCDRLSTKLV